MIVREIVKIVKEEVKKAITESSRISRFSSWSQKISTKEIVKPKQ